MELESIKESLMYLCTKYVPGRQDLIELLNSWKNITIYYGCKNINSTNI